MFLDINKIGREGITLDRHLDLPDLEGPGRERIAVLEARIQGHAGRGKRGVDFSGRLEATVSLMCSRCTEPFRASIATNFFLTLLADREEPPADEAEVREEDVSLFHAPEGKADLTTVAAEQIYLNLPLKPICSDGCKGLCPHCGVNRSRIECDCRSAEVDPRLAPLLSFKDRRPAQ